MKKKLACLALAAQLLIAAASTQGSLLGGMGTLPSPPYCPPDCTCN